MDIIAGTCQAKLGLFSRQNNYKEMVEKQKYESTNRGIFDAGRGRWKLSSCLSNQNTLSWRMLLRGDI